MDHDPQLFTVRVKRKSALDNAINDVMLICFPSQHCIRRGGLPDCTSLGEVTPVVPR